MSFFPREHTLDPLAICLYTCNCKHLMQTSLNFYRNNTSKLHRKQEMCVEIVCILRCRFQNSPRQPKVCMHMLCMTLNANSGLCAGKLRLRCCRFQNFLVGGPPNHPPAYSSCAHAMQDITYANRWNSGLCSGKSHLRHCRFYKFSWGKTPKHPAQGCASYTIILCRILLMKDATGETVAYTAL